jgi:hypothetical protein
MDIQNGATGAALDPVTADVDAILAEINASTSAVAITTPPAEPAEKPKRTRAKKNTPAAPVNAGADDAAGAQAPTPAPAATDPGAFMALLSDDARAAYATRFDEAAKKVKEKAENAIAAIDTGKKLSRFTCLAVTALVTKGEVTSGDLVQVYKDANLGEGTARAQAQQMTSLFRMFDLVSQDGRTFKLANDELGKKLAALAA